MKDLEVRELSYKKKVAFRLDEEILLSIASGNLIELFQLLEQSHYLGFVLNEQDGDATGRFQLGDKFSGECRQTLDRSHLQEDLGPIEVHLHHLKICESERLRNLLPNLKRGSGGESHCWHSEFVSQRGQALVLWPEIRGTLHDAMSLVHHQQRY